MNVKEAIRMLNHVNRLKMVDVARGAGLSRDGLYKAINGNQSLGSLVKIAKAYDMKASELIAIAEGFEDE